MTSNEKLSEIVLKLKAMSPQQWGAYAFSREPLRRKIDETKRVEYINKAYQTGIDEARKLQLKYQGLDIWQIAKRLEIDIVKSDREGSDNYVVFAKYNYPKKITLYLGNVNKLNKFIEDKNLSSLIGNIDLAGVLLAHELYHYIEEHEVNVYTKNEQIVLWTLFSYQHKSSIIALQEIAAMSFAKTLLNLDYNPYLFDCMFLLPHDEKRALTLIEEVLYFAREDDGE